MLRVLPAVTPLHGRTFSIWTSLTCVLCVLLAGDMTSKALFAVTWFSFAVAAFHFMTEWLVYRTMTFASFMRPAPFALLSMVFMLVAWPY